MTGIPRLADRQLGLEELRERQLRILDVVLEHCSKEGLRVYLCAGTLLGAVRHLGYIPWDDDIDLLLPRADYERFCRRFASLGRPHQLSVRSSATSPAWPLPFAKICDDTTSLVEESDIVRDIGVNIDVFPLDGWSDGWVRHRLQRGAIAVLTQAIRAKHLTRRPRGLARDTILAAAKFALARVPARRISEAITWVARVAASDSSRDAGVAVWGRRQVVPRGCYGSPSIVCFEGRQCPAPADPCTVLRIMYGDYLQLPPEDQRVSRHRFVAYLREPDVRTTPATTE